MPSMAESPSGLESPQISKHMCRCSEGPQQGTGQRQPSLVTELQQWEDLELML
eukprot:CAMPEP_0170596220 /NCGR_PEP_ID=MMETSP0224-20130122/14992_1 /TAXON_ID=285029 /ORGANISM="Togula jolla, Strain CCCM 725" /LENGTH=52 /DNA_ID=CAMNT_0010920479 /DNA_START=55 /DNA_END=214 /DNA_ORIENTATION=-